MFAEEEEWFNRFNREHEEQNLRDFEANPNQSYSSLFPTSDVHADKAGKVLQATDCVESLALNYTGWTKWGAHEISNFVRSSHSLSELILSSTGTDDAEILEPERKQRDAMTRTLTTLLQSIADNPKIQKVELHSIVLEGKSARAFCNLLQNSETIKKLTISKGFGNHLSEFCLGEVSAAIGANQSIRHLCFQGVGNQLLKSILEQMALSCSSSSSKSKSKLKTLRLEGEGETSDVDTQGLQELLMSSKTRLEQLVFKRVNFTTENMQTLKLGLLSNDSVDDISFQSCTFQKGQAEHALRQLLEETDSLVYLNLDCRHLNSDSEVIKGLQRNTSITLCELSNLSDNPEVGDALRNVLMHNRSIDCVKLNGDADAIDNADMRLLADGLKQNPVVDTLSIHECLFDNNGVAHLADALIMTEEHTLLADAHCGPETSRTIFALIDLEIQSEVISDQALRHFASTVRDPNSRLRSLSLSLNKFDQTVGLLELMKSLGENKTLESLHISSNEDVSIEVWRSIAKHLAQVTSLIRLDLNFGIAGEDIWREVEPKIVYNLHTDILEGLHQNTTIQHVRFGHEMYVHSTDRDQEFWTDLSFYCMRNQLHSLLPTQDGVTSVYAILKLVRRIIHKEVKDGIQWSINADRPGIDVHKANKLNVFSLRFICLRHMPHLISRSNATE